MALLIFILVFALIFLIASIPLHFAASMLGGHSTLIKAALTNVIVGVIGAFIYLFLPGIAGLLYFVTVLFIYRAMFSISWIRAFLVWIIQGIIAFLLVMLVVVLGIIAL